MQHKLFKQGFLFSVAALLTTAFACNKTAEAPPPVVPLVQVAANATLGSFLTDKNGNTLYAFANDPDGNNNCSGGCANTWPVYYAGDNFTASLMDGSLAFSDFATITTTAGQKQTTYKGWPLYNYAPLVNGANVKEAPGETKGEGIGGVWFVAKPDYTITLMNTQLIGHNGKLYKSDMTEGVGKTTYFTDAAGRTLYTFFKDSAKLNKYTKSDFSNNAIWPIYETDKIVIPSTLDKSLFSSILVFGKKQLTYKGWPLYGFGQDSLKRGANKGVSFPAVGTWPVAVKDIKVAP